MVGPFTILKAFFVDIKVPPPGTVRPETWMAAGRVCPLVPKVLCTVAHSLECSKLCRQWRRVDPSEGGQKVMSDRNTSCLHMNDLSMKAKHIVLTEEKWEKLEILLYWLSKTELHDKDNEKNTTFHRKQYR